MELKRRTLEKEAEQKNIIVANLDADVAFPEDGWGRSLSSLPAIGFSTISSLIFCFIALIIL